MDSRVAERFAEFHEEWLARLEQLMQACDSSSEERYDVVLEKLTSHHREYYSVKWTMAQEDALAFYSAPWLTPLEQCYLWHTGYRPTISFNVLESLPPAGITEEQRRKIEALRERTRMDEAKVDTEMERHQVEVASRRVVDVVATERKALRSQDPTAMAEAAAMVRATVNGMVAGVEKVMRSADCARLRCLKGILDVLNPDQRLRFLTSMSAALIQLRASGKIIAPNFSINKNKF